MKKFIILFFCLLTFSPVFAQKRNITVEDLWAMRRIEKFVLSPDGEWIACTVTQYDLNQNTSNTDIYLVSTKGGAPRQMTTHPGYDGNPCWSPDGSLLAFISTRDGTPQIYAIPMDGGEAQKLSNISGGVKDFNWSPDGRYFAFTSDVRMQNMATDTTGQAMIKGEGETIQIRQIDHLLYRHWNRWLDGKRSHLFVMPSTGGKEWDVTPGDFDTPPLSLGSSRDFTFSPDGREIAFVRNTDSMAAISTNNDIFIVPSKGGTIRRLTQNPANDNQPVYSPDGKYIAYRAMKRSGFESDQYDLMLYERKSGMLRNLTAEFDLDVGEIVWAPSTEKIFFNSQDQGRIVIFSLEIKNGKIKGLVHSGCNTNLCVASEEDDLYFLRSYTHLPHEIFSCDRKGENTFQITFTNHGLVDRLEMNVVEDFWFSSFDSRIIHGFLLKPPFYDPAKTYAALFLIHGGPQGAWQDEFHYRWNAQLFAARGYVVIMINIRGSKGYGQSFCDAVSRNWGGIPYKDLMEGLDYVLKKYPFIDPQKIAAAGGSFGGFMINWIAGHTDRFRCLVSHAGIVDPASFYGATEELWFPEWEFGDPPFENYKNYERWAPIRYAKSFVTPTLVTHGEKDFRVPVDQGLQMFTALQRKNVPSKLLLFPDEGHFITKPKNSQLWWNTVLQWIDEWTQK